MERDRTGAPPSTAGPRLVTAADAEPGTGFPVVGVGASSGGLEAFGQLLDGLSADTGMAFLLVQHLDPRHPSALVSILAQRSKMPLVEVTQDLVVQKDHVYVIPPNVTMTMVEGVLRLVPREEGGGIHLPIDELFRSIAVDCPGAAIGVVLSGNGADGTKGIEAIKDAGGLTFAQDDTAGYPAMPRSAVQSGCVDRVLSPSAIAEAIVRVANEPFPLPGPAADTDPMVESRDLTTVLALLHARFAVDFGAYRASSVQRRISRRMLLRHVREYREYAVLLAEDEEELDALYDDILINVTSFFRDPGMFEALTTTVFPRMMRDRDPGAPIRVWIPGCSTGKEVYSLLMVLIEFLDDRDPMPPFQIFATDLSERLALRKAREGVYPESIETEVSPQRLARFFTKSDGTYRVGKELREAVVFARHDVASDPPFSHMDLISCRNLLIYLSPALQQRVIATLHYALDPGGFLILGNAETVGSGSDLFAAVDQQQRIFTRRAAAVGVPRTFRSTLSASERIRARRVVASVPDWRAEADRVVLTDYVPPGVLVNEDLEVLEFRGDTAAFLAPPVGEPSNNLLQLARHGLFLELWEALQECKRVGGPVLRQRVPHHIRDETREIDLRVLPVAPVGAREQCFLVLFQERADGAVSGPRRRRRTDLPATGWASGWWSRVFKGAPPPDPEPARLRKELSSTREYLQSVIARQDAANESLTSANQETVSVNEELQSTNEELETAKEELQSVNEELTTVNEQLHNRNADLVRLSDDLTNLLGSATVPMIALDAHLAVRRFTPAASQVLHLHPTDVGRAIGKLRLPQAIADLSELCQRVLTTGNVVQREFRDDGGRWYAMRIHPYRATDGGIDGAVVVLADIHDAKHAQDLLRDSRDYVAAIVDTVRDPLIVLDVELRVQSANQAYYTRFGTTPETTDGRFVHELGSPGLQGLQGLLRQVLHGDGVLHGHEVRQGSGLEEQIWLLNASRMVGTGAHRVLLTMEDVTEDRRLASELRDQALALEAADRRKDEFLAILAHELRNPLTPVRNALEIQRRAGGDPVSTAQTQEMMERQVRHMTRLVDDLLDVSRISLGRIELRKRRVDLGAILRQTVELERPLFELSGHRVTVSLPEEPVYLYADSVRIEQIVGNLFTNAMKYTDAGGAIAFRVTVEGGMAILEVEDRGVGISATMLPRIWDLFTQADWASDRTRGGLGIGLALVKSLTELHGGSVEARSDGPGSGSRFVVRLPLAPSTLENDDTVSGATPIETLPPPRRVLVVDDDLDVAASFGMLLELMGHEVRIVHDGPSAILTAAELRPEIVFLDIGLKGMSGLDVARLLRADVRYKDSILVAVTGYGAAEDRQRSREAGFDRHIVKPAEPGELERVLAWPGRSAT